MKNLMKKCILGLALVQILLPGVGLAKVKPAEKPIAEYMAIATANTVNRLATVDGFLKWIKFRVSDAELANVEKHLLTLGLKKTDKFPKLKAEGAKVYFGKSDFMVYSKDSIRINGKVFRQSEKSFDLVVQDIVAGLTKIETAWYSDLLFPQAQAAFSKGAKYGLIGLVAGAALGAFLSPNDRTQGAVLGGALGGLTGVLAGNYLGQETYDYFGDNGQVTCNGSNYQLQPVQNVQYQQNPGYNPQPVGYQPSNINQPTYFNQPGYNQQAHPGVIQHMYQGNAPCNTQNASYMQANLQAWPQRTYVNPVSGQQQDIPVNHPGTIISQ
jgi:hypothetical protein